MRTMATCAVMMLACATAMAGGDDIFDKVEHHYVDSDGVKIHYTSIGEGPVILFVHGFPDFWYSWRYQMAGLSDSFKCVAIDGRGYNKSDKPKGVENYDISLLVGDVDAVRQDLGVEEITLVGHDWGGFIAWSYTFFHQANVKNLVIMNLTHPKGFSAVLANPTEEQKKNTDYARRFQAEGAHKMLSAAGLAGAGAHGDANARARYQTAFENSDFEAMLNYYKANYPSGADAQAAMQSVPDVTCPTLQFHGLKDTALDKDGLRDTWNWIANDYTLVTVPGASHWVQHQAHELVTDTMRWWLKARQ